MKLAILIGLTFGILLMPSPSESQGKPESETFHRLRADRVLSIWLGNFSTEDELLDYLDGDFIKDFGFEIYEPAGPEQDVSSSGAKPIFDLLEGFSDYKVFQSEAAKLAKSQGWDKATTAVVFYAFKYDPALMKNKGKAPLSFIGTLPYVEAKH